MTGWLPDLVNNVYEGIHRIKCKYGQNDKKCKTYGIRYKYCNCFLEYTNSRDDLMKCKCLCFNKSYQRKFDKKWKEGFFNRYKFSHHGNNKFILLLRKGVYPFEYMDDWERFNDTSLPEKEDFYSHLNMEEVTDPDDAHTKWIFEIKKDFEIKNLVE